MGASGTVTLDFGAFPGKGDASVAVTGQSGIASGSLVEAWLLPAATADHSEDEHRVESMTVKTGQIIAGTGFTVSGFENFGQEAHNAETTTGHLIYGAWNVAWAWV